MVEWRVGRWRELPSLILQPGAGAVNAFGSAREVKDYLHALAGGFQCAYGGHNGLGYLFGLGHTDGVRGTRDLDGAAGIGAVSPGAEHC